VLSVQRAMRGFIGPADIFRNPQAIFRLNQPTKNDEESPFDLVLTHSGSDFSVMGMHFKLGLYEHQSAGAIQALLNALSENPHIVDDEDAIQNIKIKIYEPAFGIIGDPAKRDPKTRQSADHSMLYIIGTIIRKALRMGPKEISVLKGDNDRMWKLLMLLPYDYSPNAVMDAQTRRIMNKIAFEHGGKEYDDKYPEGIPTRMEIRSKGGKTYSSDLVMFPAGHARNTKCGLKSLLQHKWLEMAKLAAGPAASDADAHHMIERLTDLSRKNAHDMQELYNIPYHQSHFKNL